MTLVPFNSSGTPCTDMNTLMSGIGRGNASAASRIARATSPGFVTRGGMKMTTIASMLSDAATVWITRR